MKIISFILVLILSINAFAANIKEDKLNLGEPTSASSKELIFNQGAGTANKKLSVSPATGVLKTNSDSMEVGDGTNTNKKVRFDIGAGASNPFVGWDSTLQSPVFSKDGTVIKKLGSGSGSGGSGGVNLISNDSFEDGTIGFTNSGGTFTVGTFTNGTEDDSKFGQFVSTASAQYLEATTATIPDTFGVGGMADVEYSTTATTWKYQVLTTPGTVIGEVTLPSTETATKFKKLSPITFVAPDPGQQFKLRFLSGEASTLKLNKVYGGTNKSLSSVSLAQIAGQSYFPVNASCVWQRSSTSMGAFTPVAACPGPTIIDGSLGQWQTTDSDLPRQTINNLPAGKYEVTVILAAGPTVSAGAAGFTLSDGTTTCQATSSNASANNSSASLTINCVFNYTSAGNRTFEVYGQSIGTTVLNLYNSDARYQTSFTVKYFPSSSDIAYTPEQSEWKIDANIGGASVSMGNANVSSYTEITNASLDLVLNSGSAPAKIPCSSTNASTGLTCSAGNEGFGLVFTNKLTGLHEVCAEFISMISQNAGASTELTFQLVETSNASQTIIQEGKGRIGPALNLVSTNGAIYYPTRVCGTFDFSSIAERTIRLMFEASVSGTVGGFNVVADRSAAAGQRDAHFTVRALQNGQSKPVTNGEQVVSTGTKNSEIFSFSFGTGAYGTVCSASPCSYLDQSGAHISSITRAAAGSYYLNTAKTYSKLKCTLNASRVGAQSQIYDGGANQFLSCTNCNLVRFYDSIGADVYGTGLCHALP